MQSGAGMAIRGSKADQQTELLDSCKKTAFFDSDLVDPLPLLFCDLLTRVTTGPRWQAACAHAIVVAGFR